jgi:hypothetical protein
VKPSMPMASQDATELIGPVNGSGII